jgi:hypothetical protein
LPKSQGEQQQNQRMKRRMKTLNRGISSVPRQIEVTIAIKSSSILKMEMETTFWKTNFKNRSIIIKNPSQERKKVKMT